MTAGLTDHILRSGAPLAGKDVKVTTMFVDVRGFTSFAEGAASDRRRRDAQLAVRPQRQDPSGARLCAGAGEVKSA
jgi:hypothetical protein